MWACSPGRPTFDLQEARAPLRPPPHLHEGRGCRWSPCCVHSGFATKTVTSSLTLLSCGLESGPSPQSALSFSGVSQKPILFMSQWQVIHFKALRSELLEIRSLDRWRGGSIPHPFPHETWCGGPRLLLCTILGEGSIHNHSFSSFWNSRTHRMQLEWCARVVQWGSLWDGDSLYGATFF